MLKINSLCFTPHPQIEVMELQYRGVRYSLNSNSMNVKNASAIGQYRGAKVRFHQPIHKLAIQQVLHLMYRGIKFDEAIGTPIA